MFPSYPCLLLQPGSKAKGDPKTEAMADLEVDEELRGYMSDGGEWIEPPYEPDYSTAIVVDNLPKVPKDKYEKLLTFVKKIYVQLGNIVEDGLQMPFDEAKNTSLGFAFINFQTREEAEKAIAATNNWNFDKSHALQVREEAAEGGLDDDDDNGSITSHLCVYTYHTHR